MENENKQNDNKHFCNIDYIYEKENKKKKKTTKTAYKNEMLCKLFSLI